MATLMDEDYQDLKKRIGRDAAAKDVFRAWGLDKGTWKAVFQAAEDWFVDGFSVAPAVSFKAMIDTATGGATNSQAIQIGKIWMGWRYDRFMGT